MISNDIHAKEYDIITHPNPKLSDVLAKLSLKLGNEWENTTHIKFLNHIPILVKLCQ